MTTLHKVTVFITRRIEGVEALLLLEHPYAGIQLPAGTVEPAETPEAAAWREAREETALRADDLELLAYCGVEESDLPPEKVIVVGDAPTLYARPDAGSPGWAFIPRGARVDVEREQDEWVHVSYREWDHVDASSYVTYQLTGWVRRASLSSRQERHFYHFRCRVKTEPQWRVQTDNHTFTLFWARRDALPELHPFFQPWLGYLARCEDD
ncbi:MAG: NUDIX domain-containing protein [Candidatus Promineifilaceae bacterium]|nr:NUDIX domain-containing protein [Candidatus Promineifilaceae bacterium]